MRLKIKDLKIFYKSFSIKYSCMSHTANNHLLKILQNIFYQEVKKIYLQTHDLAPSYLQCSNVKNQIVSKISWLPFLNNKLNVLCQDWTARSLSVSSQSSLYSISNVTVLLPTKILASSRNHKRHKIYLYKPQETSQTSSYATSALVLKYFSFRGLVSGSPNPRLQRNEDISL